MWTERDKDRLLAKRVELPNGCWGWTGAVFKATGYGVFSAKSDDGVWRPHTAHRAAYEMLVGPVPDGLHIDHLCRNRWCCNPAHLEPVTKRVNDLRGDSPMARQARQTHCLRGHPLAGDNLRVRPSGKRECRECARARDRNRGSGWERMNPVTDRAAYLASGKSCMSGHLMDEGNTYWSPSGRPMCRACRNLAARRSRATR